MNQLLVDFLPECSRELRAPLYEAIASRLPEEILPGLNQLELPEGSDNEFFRESLVRSLESYLELRVEADVGLQ